LAEVVARRPRESSAKAARHFLVFLFGFRLVAGG